MKRYCLFFITILLSSAVLAQGVFDAMRYAETPINGTARYMGMAGAFGALGGEAGAISDNPAGLGIYRNSEFAVTAKALVPVTQGSWQTTRQQDDFNFCLNNASFVLSFLNSEKEKGVLASNFGFGYNRLKHFTRSFSLQGASSLNSMTDYMAGFTNGLSEDDLKLTEEYEPFDNENVPWLSVLAYESQLILPGGGNTWHSLLKAGEKSQPFYQAQESGYIDEFAFSYAANVSDKVYLGASFTMQTLDYSLISSYKEVFQDGGSFILTNRFSTSGFGWNFKFGAIVRPTDFMRVGASIHTPTYFTLRDGFKGKSVYDTTIKGSVETPNGQSNYRFTAPLKFQASMAFIIAKSGIISLDYMLADNRGTTRLKHVSSDLFLDTEPFALDNEDIKNFARIAHTVKLGGEYRINKAFSVRAGMALVTPSMSDRAEKFVPLNTIRTDMEYMMDRGSIYGAAGFGYRSTFGFGVDVAYAYRQKIDLFKPYNSTIEPATVKTHYNNILLSLSYKF